MKNLKRNIITILIYSVVVFLILLIGFEASLKLCSVALLSGFTLSFLNELLTQLRKLNGEKFKYLDDDSNET